jgi:transposase
MPVMSDRFDHTLEHTLKTKPDEGDEPVVDVRRIEVVTGHGRRRQWSGDDKARIVVESLKPGANVSAIARRHGLSPQQLFGWRREARALFCEEAGAEPGSTASRSQAPTGGIRSPRPSRAFAPVVLIAPAAAPPGSGGPPSGAKAGVIEIAVGGMVVRVIGSVDAETLATVLAVTGRAAR